MKRALLGLVLCALLSVSATAQTSQTSDALVNLAEEEGSGSGVRIPPPPPCITIVMKAFVVGGNSCSSVVATARTISNSASRRVRRMTSYSKTVPKAAISAPINSMCQ